MRERVQQFIVDRMIERPSSKLTLAEQASMLQRGGDRIDRRLAAVADTPANRAVISHIIGIERWGQQRLLVLAGEPFARDEYDAYAFSPALPLSDLRGHFATTRRGTVALVNILALAGVSPSRTVPHNDFGDLTLRGWLRYLGVHAEIESRKLR
ncbi:MAG: hypothetical protein OHK0022_13030 [Roseiflexaceae bacterium]